MKAVIVNRCQKSRIPRQFLNKWVRVMAREMTRHRLKIRATEIVLVFVEPKEIKSLNRRYRRRNSPTDVLSFEAADKSSLGELVLCPQVLRAQAVNTGLSYQHELGYMIVHGCLHLLGYDHETNKMAERKMFALQDKIFSRMISLDF